RRSHPHFLAILQLLGWPEPNRSGGLRAGRLSLLTERLLIKGARRKPGFFLFLLDTATTPYLRDQRDRRSTRSDGVGRHSLRPKLPSEDRRHVAAARSPATRRAAVFPRH